MPKGDPILCTATFLGLILLWAHYFLPSFGHFSYPTLCTVSQSTECLGSYFVMTLVNAKYRIEKTYFSTFFYFFLSSIVVELVGGGAVIKRATPSSFWGIQSFPVIIGKVGHGKCASVTTHFQPLSSLIRICRRFTVSVSYP